MSSQSQRLPTAWPQRLGHMISASAAVAIETAAVTIRQIACRFDTALNPSLRESNPLFDFALGHDGTKGALTNQEQLHLLDLVCRSFELDSTELSFDAIMSSPLMTRTFWDHPELALIHLYERSSDRLWVPAKMGGSTGAVSLVHWDGQSALGEVLERRFKEHTGRHSVYGTAIPRVLRVRFKPRSRSFNTLRYTELVAPFLQRSGEPSGLEIKTCRVRYVLVGAIRHRSAHQLEVVRFYNDEGIYEAPPRINHRYVPRPYVSDDWRIGEEGHTYTLLYAPSNDTDKLSLEFIKENMLATNSTPADVFEGPGSITGVKRRRMTTEDELEEESETRRLMPALKAAAAEHRDVEERLSELIRRKEEDLDALEKAREIIRRSERQRGRRRP